MNVKALYPSIPRQESQEVIASFQSTTEKKVYTNSNLEMIDASREKQIYVYI